MKRTYKVLRNLAVLIGIMGVCLAICLAIYYLLDTSALIPAIFVLGAFLVSALTEGYTYGIFASLIGVLMVNFAFTFPYFRLNFSISENLVSAVIMIIVSLMTCALTTQIKKAEAVKAESEKERMRANLLRAVSHDLRTPLTTIYGSSSALLENYDKFSDKQKKTMLRDIRTDAQWLHRMVENLLSITKLDNGNVKIIKSETVLDELIDSVLVKFAKRYPEQEVTVQLPDEFVLILMDAILIEQVLVNLLENAVQHADGMTQLGLTVTCSEQKAIFEIIDNGCGIAQEKLKTIFTGYFKASEDDLSDGKAAYAGIGLSVCATIIKAHGGEITAQNRPEGGMIFRFTLDLERESYEQQ